MSSTRVWIDLLDLEKIRLLVWHTNCFYCAKVDYAEPAVWQERIQDCDDLMKLLGPGTQAALIDEITSVEVTTGGKVRIFYSDGRPNMIKIDVAAKEMEVLDIIKSHRPNWRADVRKGTGMTGGLKLLGSCLVVSAFLGGMYVLIANNLIDRAHWLIALTVNLCGPIPLLIVAILFLLFGLGGGGFMMLKPTQTHVLRPAP